MKSHVKALSMLFAAVIAVLFVRGVSAASDGRIRIGIAPFDSKVEEVGAAQAAIITDIFTNTLYNSKRIMIVEREKIGHILDEILGGDTGFYDPNTVAEIGRLANIQYLVLGAVTEVSKKSSAGGVPIPFLGGGTIGGSNMEATAKLATRVVEVETGEVVLSLSQIGKSTNSSMVFSFAGVTWGEGEFGGIEARAIGGAALRLAHKIRERLADDYSYVIETGAKEFMIDEGETRAVEPGMLFLVYGDGRTLLDMEGNAVARKRVPLAVLKVTRTDFDMSYCSVADGTKASIIERGDKIEPISSEEASKMVKEKVFPAKRPEGLLRGWAGDLLPPIAGEGNDDLSPGEEGTIAAEQEKPKPEPAQGTQVTEPPAAREPAPRKPAPKPAPAAPKPAQGNIDVNTSANVEVIKTYDIPQKDRRILEIQHRGAWNLYSKKKYKDALDKFIELADAYPKHNYLSAYWAGMCALKVKARKDEARGWFERALDINPDYQPATDALAKLKKK
jgi:curli biogenesis system outer membrane secretion channel CsgG/TolA-binding protein